MTLMSTPARVSYHPTLRLLDFLRNGSLGNKSLTTRGHTVYNLVANMTLQMKKWPSPNHGEPAFDKYVF